MLIKEKRSKWLCCVVAAIMLLTVAFTLPLVTDDENVYAATFGEYEYTVLNNSAIITKYKGRDSNIIIPGTIGGYPVTAIGQRAFNSNASLVSVTIPSSVRSIDFWAFERCYSLTSISVASGNMNYSSENGVLFNRSKTQLITFPAGKNGTYEVPGSVISIGDYAFESCRYLTSVTIRNNVRSIGYSAFSDCPNLRFRAYEGSFAERYAREYGIPCDLIGNSPSPSPAAPSNAKPSNTAAKPTTQPAAPKKLAAPKATAGKRQVKITWKKSTTKGISGYEVQYRIVGQKWAAKATKKIGAKATSITIKKLTPGKRYDLRVRALKKSGGKTSYGAWSNTTRSGTVKR
ncbi:MAG: fibronectin type III domain-containing protein [Clostridiales Family XIII bacterium]|nr:fibronectin type III domain-containing protein [Clostridiales Family XIII bacterium]